MHEIGVNAGEGLINGTEEIQPKAIETAKTLAKSFIDAVAETIKNSRDIDNATRQNIEEMRRTADSAVQTANFHAVGEQIAQGEANGINSGSGIVSNAARNLINNALAAMRAAADVSSPSKKSGEIADQIGDGLILRMVAKAGSL